VALVLLQLFFDDEGCLVRSDTMPGGAAVGKSSVRTRLEWIITLHHEPAAFANHFEEGQRFFTFATHAPPGRGRRNALRYCNKIYSGFHCC
jgi:hypothetical protein